MSRRTRWAELSEDFLEVDTRWLAVQRIALGLLLLAYLAALASGDRLTAYFSDAGMLPLDVVDRAAPGHLQFSVFAWAHTASQAGWLVGLEAALAVCVVLGAATRVTAPLALLGLISIHHRIPFVVNASMVSMHLVALPWVLLPLGARGSVDAWLARRLGRPGAPARIRSLAPLVLRLQLFAIYYFNAVHKSGDTWLHGEAVHYVFYASHAAWPSTVWLRAHEPSWLSPALTYFALCLEYTLAVLLVLPARRAFCRRAAATLMCLLHGGIALVVDLGPFPFVFGVAALMLLAAEDGAPFDRIFGTAGPSRGVTPDSAGFTWIRESLLLAHLAVALCLVWSGNAAMRLVLGPAPRFDLAHRVEGALYAGQAWGMFAPQAPTVDRLLVPVAVLDDGRWLEVDTRRLPSFEGLDTRYSTPDFLLQTYESQLVDRANGELWEAYARYQAGRPRRERWPGGARVARVVVNHFLMIRPPPEHSGPWLTHSTVAFDKQWLPIELPGRLEL